MAEAPWKKLVDELVKAGHQSPLLDKLRQLHPGLSGGQRGLELELLQEMGASLRRADEKITVCLLKLEVMGLRLDALSEKAPERAELVREFDAERERAKRAVWELLVQREAIGFRRNGELATLYPIPPRRR